MQVVAILIVRDICTACTPTIIACVGVAGFIG